MQKNDFNDRDNEFKFLLSHVARIVIGEGQNSSDFDLIYGKLRSISDNLSAIDEIIEWLKIQNSTGQLSQTLEFVFQSPLHDLYQENFLITGLVPDFVRHRIESLRLKGILTEGMCEQVYSIALSSDAMVWTEDELEQVILDLYRSNPFHSGPSIPVNFDIKTTQSFHS